MAQWTQSVARLLAVRWLVVAAALVVSGVTILPRIPTELQAHPDTTRDLLLARVCQDDICPMLGPPSSMGGIHQGGWWPLHLAIWEMLGFEPDGMFLMALLLNLMAMGLLVWALFRSGGGWSALTAGALCALTALWMFDYWTTLWNPLLTPFFSTGFVLALLAALRSGSVLPAVASMAFLTVGLQTHVAAVVLLAPWSLVVAVRYDRKAMLVSGIAGLALAALGVWVFSKDALRLTLQAAAQSGYGSGVLLPSMFGAACLWGTLLMAVRFWWRRGRAASGRSPHWLLHAGALLAVLVPLVGWILGLHPDMEDRYLAPIVPLAIVSISLGVGRIEGCVRLRPSEAMAWIRTVVPWILAFLPLILGPAPSPSRASAYRWSYAQADSVADMLFDEYSAPTYQLARAAIRTPERGLLLLALARLLPEEPWPETEEGLNLGLTTMPRCGVEDGSSLLVAKGRQGRWLCGHRFSPVLDWGHVWLRWGRQVEKSRWHPFGLLSESGARPVPYPLGSHGVALPGMLAWVDAWVPVHLSPGQNVRLVSAAGCESDTRVMFSAARGVEAHFPSPTEASLSGGPAGGQGWVLVKFRSERGAALPDRQIQPAVWEGPDDDLTFEQFRRAVTCYGRIPTRPEESDIEGPPDQAFPEAEESSLLAQCGKTHGVACLMQHVLSPVRFPFTLAVFFYVVAMAGIGWSWLVSLRVLSSSEWREMR